MIYAMQASGGGPVKIGCTNDVARRHKQLETHYGRELVLLAVMEGGVEQERKIHERFAHLRLRSKRRGCLPEQFRPTPELMGFIGCRLLVSPNPDAMEVMEPASHIKPIIMQLRGTPEYKEWLEGLAEFDATSVAEMAERAFAMYAREIGYNKARPKR